MHVMLMLASYPPIIDSCARLYSELSESLRKMGHTVTVICEYPSEPGLVDRTHAYFTGGASPAAAGETVLRVSALSFIAEIPGGKALRFWLSCLLFAVRGLFAKRPDVILVYSPPLYMGISGYIISKLKRTRFVFNLQDIHPKVLVDLGAIKNPLIKNVLYEMEKVCYKKATVHQNHALV